MMMRYWLRLVLQLAIPQPRHRRKHLMRLKETYAGAERARCKLLLFSPSARCGAMPSRLDFSIFAASHDGAEPQRCAGHAF